jgi:phosphohistidine phosphatase
MNLLVLVHHGPAVGPEIDPARPLSSVGRAATERLAAAAAQRGVKPDVVWHSGKLRARQTAELFWKACNPFAPLSAARGLQPDDSPGRMRDQLAGEVRSVLIAGHLPSLSRLLATLQGEADGSLSASFPPHGCVALLPDEDRWKEVWRLEG